MIAYYIMVLMRYSDPIFSIPTRRVAKHKVAKIGAITQVIAGFQPNPDETIGSSSGDFGPNTLDFNKIRVLSRPLYTRTQSLDELLPRCPAVSPDGPHVILLDASGPCAGIATEACLKSELAPKDCRNAFDGRRRLLGTGAIAVLSIGTCGTPDATEKPRGSLGEPTTRYGRRSPREAAARHLRTTRTPESSSSRTPLGDSRGILTPSALHFERHHAGVPSIDPDDHRLLIHGLVERPLILTVAELKRLPSVSSIHFIECAGNGGSEWGPRTAPDVQQSHGLASCSEWTGVQLSLLLREVGADDGATWLLAEGADACKMQRSIPMTKAMDDAIVAYGQNGEALRPEQGYPLRLVLPGWEGNTSIKWLRRIKVTDQPHMTRDETSR